ncbi:unnamed protein product [Fraxinus pennsylvanica]|uniref:non-specific serine/threonine protein kinase n=1 Tax=Fraxinus pennsylvanica TaxID=56036 RepID=A0AAD2DP01_9LAMI|nr:unnamed protein product [Fraxinus pennsylvanica]
MHPKLTRRYFLPLISLLLIRYIPGSLCQNGGEYATCGAPFQCAGIRGISYPFFGWDRPEYCGYPGFQLNNCQGDCAGIRGISYPFFGGDRPEYCGYPGFQLNNCQGDVPILTISSVRYRVLEIDNSGKTVRVAREDLWNITCPRFLYNTTLEQNVFLLSPNYPIITLYYGCSTINGQAIPQLPSMFPCVVNDTSSASFFTVGGNFPSIPGLETGIRCETNISVPVNQAAAGFLAGSTASIVSLQDALASGFSLQWSANNNVCENCTRSGGLCGTNRDSQSFACYCVNGTSASTCNSIETENGT